MNSKKISQLSLSPNACYVQFKIPSQAELLLSISKGFWIFFVKSNQFISRKIPWTFVKFRCYYYYLQVLEMCRVVCFNIMVEKFKLPAVGYLPWPLPTSNFKKNSKFKNLHTQNRKNPRNCYYYNLLSPVGLVIFVSSESKFLSYIIIQSCDLYYKIIIFYLGFKKTGCRRRNVLKEDLVAEDKIRKLVSSLWARLPGYGQKRPRCQWVPGYPMVWDMEFSLVCCKFKPETSSSLLSFPYISSLIFSSPRGLQLLVPPPCRG